MLLASRGLLPMLRGGPMGLGGVHETSTRDMCMKVGFIGLGNMGAGMASRLLGDGVNVHVHDINKDQEAILQQKGAQIATSPASLSSEGGMNAIITMLPSTEHVQAVYTGNHGLLAPEKIRCPLFIDCSTISPLRTREIAQMVSEKYLCEPDTGQKRDAPEFVDAPVSGGVPAAVKGTLTFMAGASDSAFKKASAVLQLMGKQVIHMGPPGSGQAAKICNNLVLGVSMAAVSEGLALGQSLGIDPEQLSRLFNTSSARCWSCDTYNPVPGVMHGVPSARNYEAGFMNRLMIKDLGLALHATGEQGSRPIDLPMCKEAQELYQQAAEELGEHKDFSSVFQLYQKRLQATCA